MYAHVDDDLRVHHILYACKREKNRDIYYREREIYYTRYNMHVCARVRVREYIIVNSR